MSDIYDTLGGGARLAEIGKIKLGGLDPKERQTRAGGTWRAPVKWDSFRVTSTERDAAGNFAIDGPLNRTLLDLQHGPHAGGPDTRKLTEIPIFVLSDDIREILALRWALYERKGLCSARCDGVTFEQLVDASGHKLAKPTTRPCDGADHAAKGFKLHAILSCCIAAKDAAVGGVYRFRTTSVIGVRRLLASFKQIQEVTGGVLMGVPMRLVVKPMTVTPEGSPIKVFVVHVELRGSDIAEIQTRALEASRKRVLLIEAHSQYRDLVVIPGNESVDEQVEIAAEFHAGDGAPVVETPGVLTVDEADKRKDGAE